MGQRRNGTVVFILSFRSELGLNVLTILLSERRVTTGAIPRRFAKKKRDSVLAFSDVSSSLSSTVNSDISAGILIRLFVYIFSFFQIGTGLGVLMKGRLPSEFDDRNATRRREIFIALKFIMWSLVMEIMCS